MRTGAHLLLRAVFLCGATLPVSAQYQGGDGDGHDMLDLAFTLEAYDPAAVYSGGAGDGHDMLDLGFTLSAYDPAALFSGGAGDGHDMLDLGFTLSAYDPAALFSGGAGDGHDMLDLAFTLTAYDPAVLFSGGAGDGHDMLDLAFTLAAYDPVALFSGGGGDGHDMLDLAFTLAAYDPVALFSGGGGDGYDMALLEPGSPFPLTLLTFEAVAKADYVLLTWVTADEVDTDYFTVEKSREGFDFKSIGRTAAAGKTPRGVKTYYAFEDGAPWEGTTYYRLRSIDLDGTFSLSDIRTVDFRRAAGWDFTVFPNPNDGSRLGIQLTGGEHQGAIHTDLYSASGRRILNHTFPAEVTGRYTLPVGDVNLPSGSYYLRVSKGEEQISKLLVVKRR
ncbi:T9SS type A sorting domain-containing protein [Lewinella sp. IMCC34191]|uniref:T9SS type A sorting domain-containing protein n=1 Tax=Lewinella sp. IMCC34191 TaxID=2259172 RepID=UPI000E27C9D7|nr:T9SS type A sorting domain-containing protein [Lewinella sp. IMCC34191]